jgi:hypothetical protein
MQATWLAFVTGKVLQKGSCMPASWLTALHAAGIMCCFAVDAAVAEKAAAQ